MNTQDFSEGRLCRASGRTEQFVILGNSIDDDNTIWCADDATGETHYLSIDFIEPGEDRQLCVTAEKAARWASSGNGSAAWWLGWYYDGQDHYRSTWYYVAAMRMDATKRDLFEVVYENAQFAAMCEGFDEPDLEFLKDIEEFNQFAAQKLKIDYGKWQDAIARISDAEKN